MDLSIANMLAGQLAIVPDTWLKPITAGLIGLFVIVLVLALFGHRGRMEMTPEREVALAAGHADRRTVFESAVLMPIMWVLLVLGRYLRLRSLNRWLDGKLVAAGSPNFYTAEEYVAVSLLWGTIAGAAVIAVNWLVGFGLPAVIAFAIGVALGFCGALYHLRSKADKRVKEIGRRVPYTLDLISLSMGAGGTFTEAVQTLVRDDPEHPFNVEMNTVLAEVELGTTRRRALMNMADRIPLEQLRSIVAAVIQAEGLGTPLSDVLKEQANLMRLERSVRAEKLAAQASVRILLPGMLILVSVVLTIFAPLIILAIRGRLF